MKHMLNNIKQLIAVIVSISLVTASVPAEMRGSFFLAPPGYVEYTSLFEHKQMIPPFSNRFKTVKKLIEETGLSVLLGNQLQLFIIDTLSREYLNLIVTKDELRNFLAEFVKTNKEVPKLMHFLQNRILDHFLEKMSDIAQEVKNGAAFEEEEEVYELFMAGIRTYGFPYVKHRIKERKKLISEFVLFNIHPSGTRLGSTVRSKAARKLMMRKVFANEDPTVFQPALEAMIEALTLGESKLCDYFSKSFAPLFQESQQLPRFTKALVDVFIKAKKGEVEFYEINSNDVFIKQTISIIEQLADESFAFKNDLITYLNVIAQKEGIDIIAEFSDYFEARSKEELAMLLYSFSIVRELKKPIHVSFIMPMYEEIRRLMPWSQENKYGEDAFRRKIEQLQELHKLNPHFKWHLIVVDDGSPTEECFEYVKDQWEEIQKTEGLSQEQVLIKRISPKKKNQMKSRKGGAVIYGMMKAIIQGWADYIGYTDTDTSIDIRLTGLLLESLVKGESQVSIGSRWCKGAARKGIPIHGKLSSIGFSWLVHRIIPPLKDISDIQRGFKLFKKEAIGSFIDFVKDKGLAFDVELLLLSKRAGLKIKEVPIFWFESRKASTLHLLSDAYNMVKSVLKIRRHLTWRKISTVFVWDEERGFLVTRRSFNDKDGPGKYETGITETLEPGDMYPGDGYKQAAIRGLEHELGIKVKPKNLVQVGYKGGYVYKHKKRRNTLGTLYFYTLTKGTEIKLEKDGEIAEIYWMKTPTDLYGFLEGFRKDLKNVETGQLYFSPQLEYLYTNPEALKKVFKLMGVDEITQAVWKIKIDHRIPHRRQIIPEIKNFLNRFADPETEEGKKLISELKNLHNVSKKPFFKKRMYRYFGIGVFLIGAAMGGIYPLLQGGISLGIGIPVTIVGFLFGIVFIYLGVKTFKIINTGAHHFICTWLPMRYVIALDEAWEFDALIHEFGHFINSQIVLGLDDKTRCLGYVFEYLMNKDSEFWQNGLFASDYYHRHYYDIQYLKLLSSLEEAREYLVEKLIEREKLFFKQKGRFPKDDDKDTGKYLALMIRTLFPADENNTRDKEAFQFIGQLFRELKIRRNVEKVKFNKRISGREKIDIKNNINKILKRFIDTETNDGEKILYSLRRIKIFPDEASIKHRRNKYLKRAFVAGIITVGLGVSPVLFGIFALWAKVLIIIASLIFTHAYFGIAKNFYYFILQDEVSSGLAKYVKKKLKLKKDKSHYFNEAFIGLAFKEQCAHQEGYNDGFAYGETVKDKSLFRAKKNLIGFIQQSNVSNTYVGAYIAGAIRALFPDNDKEAFAFLVTVFRELQAVSKKEKISKHRKTFFKGSIVVRRLKKEHLQILKDGYKILNRTDEEHFEVVEGDTISSFISGEVDGKHSLIPVVYWRKEPDVKSKNIEKGYKPKHRVGTGIFTIIETDHPYRMYTFGLKICPGLVLKGKKDGKNVLVVGHIATRQIELIDQMFDNLVNDLKIKDLRGMIFTKSYIRKWMGLDIENKIKKINEKYNLDVKIREIKCKAPSSTDVLITQDGILAAHYETAQYKDKRLVFKYKLQDLEIFLWEDLTKSFDPNKNPVNFFEFLGDAQETLTFQMQRSIPAYEILKKSAERLGIAKVDIEQRRNGEEISTSQ